MASVHSYDRWIVVIGVLKLLKAVAVGGLGVDALRAGATPPTAYARRCTRSASRPAATS